VAREAVRVFMMMLVVEGVNKPSWTSYSSPGSELEECLPPSLLPPLQPQCPPKDHVQKPTRRTFLPARRWPGTQLLLLYVSSSLVLSSFRFPYADSFLLPCS
jgi:hypothetical protein